jgi:hypothetical protein
MSLPLPKWFINLPPDEQAKCRTKLLLKMAAIYANDEGSIPALSRACGMGPGVLSSYASENRTLTPSLCLKIEEQCNRAVTRQMMNPEIFAE